MNPVPTRHYVNIIIQNRYLCPFWLQVVWIVDFSKIWIASTTRLYLFYAWQWSVRIGQAFKWEGRVRLMTPVLTSLILGYWEEPLRRYEARAARASRTDTSNCHWGNARGTKKAIQLADWDTVTKTGETRRETDDKLFSDIILLSSAWTYPTNVGVPLILY